jgi:protocatechuate 3,4-dioxygenase beta subunit
MMTARAETNLGAAKWRTLQRAASAFVPTFGFLLACAPMLFGQGTSSIEGQVVNAVTGAPLRNANVTLSLSLGVGASGQPPQSGTRAAQTNDQGRFAFRDLPAGGYRLSVQRQGYLDPASQQTASSPSPLMLGEDHRLTGTVIRLTPHSVIAGKVLDSAGEPVAGAHMTVHRWRYVGGKRQLGSVASGPAPVTNDLGEYRIAGLAAGSYFVSATPPRSGGVAYTSPDQPMPDQPDVIDVSTYYPAALDPAAAKPVTLTAGAETRGIDVKLAKAKTVRIRGMVIDPGAPPNGVGSVSMRPRGSAAGNQFGVGAVYSGGSFLITGVLPGSYYLVAQRSNGQAAVTAMQPIEVTDKNVDGITLEFSLGYDVQGAIRTEAGACGYANIALAPEVSITGVRPQAAVSGASNFVLKNVAPGSYTLNVGSGVCYVRSVRFNGRDVQDFMLNIDGPGPLEIALASSSAVMEGEVTDSNGRPLPRGAVTFVPKTGALTTLRSVNSRPDGRFQLSGLAPGAYDVFAWENLDYGAVQSREYLKQFESRAKSITVEASGRTTLQLTAIPASAAGESAPAPEPPHAKGLIEGQVLHAGTGAPLRSATVTLGRNMRPRMGPRVAPGVLGGALVASGARVADGNMAPGLDATAETDAQGRFSIRDIEPGMYYISAERPGFNSSSPAGSPNMVGQQIVVGEGQRIAGFSIRLAPQSVIAGKVSDEFGEAVGNAQVVAYSAQYSGGVRRMARIGGAPTDDLGQFRLAGMAPGAYYLSVTRRLPPRSLPSIAEAAPNEPEMGYGMTWYPNAPEFGGASPVVVGNADLPGIDIVLRRVRVVRVRGTVLDSAGNLNQRLNVGLAPKGLGTMFSTTGNLVLGRNGAFEFTNVPPGSYVLSARAIDTGSNRMAFMPVDVRDSNIDGIKLELTSGREVRGVVKAEGGARFATVRLSSADGFVSPLVNAAPDGTFTVRQVWPLAYSVDAMNLCATCYVKSVRYGGREVPEQAIDFSGDGELEITVSAAAASLEGTAVDRQGRPAARAVVFVAPAGGAGAIRTGTADARGRFYFGGLRPGAYQVFAWESGAPEASPEALARFQGQAKAVTLGENARESVQVTVR